MVKFHDDSQGRLAIIHSTEGRTWKQLVDHVDLVDLYFYAAICGGPKYTRIATNGARVDMARLDWIYSINGGGSGLHILNV